MLQSPGSMQSGRGQEERRGLARRWALKRDAGLLLYLSLLRPFIADGGGAAAAAHQGGGAGGGGGGVAVWGAGNSLCIVQDACRYESIQGGAAAAVVVPEIRRAENPPRLRLSPLMRT